MQWKIEYPKSFLKKTVKLIEKNPKLKQPIKELFLNLESNPFGKSLKTHSLTGNLKGSYSCSLSHGLRVIFRIYENMVHLLDIGSHDEVY